MFWRTSSNDLETRYNKTRIRSQYHEHVNQKPWPISEFPLISSDQNYIPMQKKYIYIQFSSEVAVHLAKKIWEASGNLKLDHF